MFFYKSKNMRLRIYSSQAYQKTASVGDGMLLVSRSELAEEDAIEAFYYYGFHLSSSFSI